MPDLITWRQGRCLPYGDGVSYWALGEMVKAEAGILETDPDGEAAAKLDRSVDGADRGGGRASLGRAPPAALDRSGPGAGLGLRGDG